MKTKKKEIAEMKTKCLVFILLVSLLLSSCGSIGASRPSEESHDIIESETGRFLPVSPMISENRISVYRHHLNVYFTLSETGIYSITRNDNGTFAVYCDKHADQFVRVCSRPDCTHTDANCDAFLDDSSYPPLGYYKGKLYYIKRGQASIITTVGGESYGIAPAELWEMDTDGRNKRLVTTCWEEGENIIGYMGITYTNGYVDGVFVKVDENGTTEYVHRYTSLDHPGIFLETEASKQFSPGDFFSNGDILHSDGDTIIVQDSVIRLNPQKADNREYFSLYAWDPIENSLRYIGDRPYTQGYFGEKTAYIVEEGIVKQWNYQSYTDIALFDTGIKTSVSLDVFPDCLVVSDTYLYKDLLNDMWKPEDVKNATLRFYDWNYTFLGECQLSFDKEQPQYGNYIFGETEDRILLVKDGFAKKPDYYIEKSDFVSGKITLHEYHYPETDSLE